MNPQKPLNTRKVLMVAYVFPPIAYAGTYRTLRFCRYLPQNGWIPHVLTIKEADDLDNDYGLLDRISKEVRIYRTRTIDFWRFWRSQKKETKTSSEIDGGKQEANKNIRRNRNCSEKVKSFLWKLVTTPDHMVFWIPFAVLKGIWILHKEKCDLIYTSSPPHSEQIIGYILSKIFRKPWVADFRDPWVDADDFDELTSHSNLISNIHRFLERLVVKNATKISMISPTYTDHLITRYRNIEHSKFITLVNGYDSNYKPAKPNNSYKKFTIVHAGTFYSNRKPDLFFLGLRSWLESIDASIRKTVQVFFVGKSHIEISEKIKSYGLQDIIRCLPLMPQKEVVMMMMASHLLLLVTGLDEKSKGVLTSKLFDYLSIGKPILAIVPEGDAAKIVRECGAGYVVSEEDPSMIAKHLQLVFGAYANGGDPGVKFNQQVIESYDSKTITERLANTFNACLERPRANEQFRD